MILHAHYKDLFKTANVHLAVLLRMTAALLLRSLTCTGSAADCCKMASRAVSAAWSRANRVQACGPSLLLAR